MSKYICITIGPIVNTLIKARKTRETWMSSFLFSTLMKILVSKVENREQIIIPYSKDSSELQGVGLYPDHLVYYCEDNSVPDLDALIEEAREELLKQMIGVDEKGNILSKIGDYPVEVLRKFLKDYLLIYYFVLDVSALPEEDKKEKNFLTLLDQVFNTIELQGKVTPYGTFKLTDLFRMIPKMALYEKAFGENQMKRMLSLVEIATKGLYRLGPAKYEQLVLNKIIMTDEAEDTGFLEGIKAAFPGNFKNHHKYVAVIQSDGDKMGKFNQRYIDYYLQTHPDSSANAIQEVSNALFKWAKGATERIKTYGGIPVYAGGDDLFFFAPLKDEEENNTLFHLLEELNVDFTACMSELLGEQKEGGILPTLSFGVSITYYKYPLGEAHQAAFDLMYEMKANGGNGIRCKILRHSGSDFDFCMHFGSTLWEKFEELLTYENLDENVLWGVTRCLRGHQAVFKAMIGNIEEQKLLDNITIQNKKDRIQQFFIHNAEGYQEDAKNSFLGKVEKFVEEIYTVILSEKTDPMLLIYDVLRIVKFINGLEEVK